MCQGDARNPYTALTVVSVASSIGQLPDPGTTSSVTCVAALRITAASLTPNDFSPPIANTGMVSLFLIDYTLSLASFRIDRNCTNAALIAAGWA